MCVCESERLIYSCACACAVQFVAVDVAVVAVHFTLLLLLLTFFVFFYPHHSAQFAIFFQQGAVELSPFVSPGRSC